MDKRVNKKKGEVLQLFLHFRKRDFVKQNKRGKGSYSRKQKHKDRGC